MVYNTIYELQWESSPEGFFENILLLIFAVLAIFKAVDCWKEKEKNPFDHFCLSRCFKCQIWEFVSLLGVEIRYE